MALIRILIHGLALSTANIVSIIVAFGVYRVLGTSHQLMVQVPVAVVLSIALFLLWVLLIRIPFLRFIAIETFKELSWILMASLALGPVVFIPLHHATQGYLTGSGNLIALFQFQLPVNVLVILAAKKLIKPISK